MLNPAARVTEIQCPSLSLVSSQPHCGFCDWRDIPTDFDTICPILTHKMNMQNAAPPHLRALFADKTIAGST